MKYPSYSDCPEQDVYVSFGKGYSTEPKHSYSLTGLLSLPQICNLDCCFSHKLAVNLSWNTPGDDAKNRPKQPQKLVVTDLNIPQNFIVIDLNMPQISLE